MWCAMHQFDELCAYVAFGHEDAEALRRGWPRVEPHVRAITDRFYDVILRFPTARQVFADDAQVERLKVSLAAWLKTAFHGPHDHAYYERRLAIGRAHVRVQLPNRYMYTAMNRVRAHLKELVDGDDRALRDAIDKLLDIELAIMAGTYLEESERDHMVKLRDLIVSHLPSCMFVLDGDGVVTSATALGGPFLRGNPIGRRATETLIDDLASTIDLGAAVERARTSRQPIDFPRTDVIVDGARRAVRVGVLPVDHALASCLVHLEDLTTVVDHEDRARNAENLASLGTMAASVAHEIRNPLAGISGVVQVVASSLPADDDRLPALIRVQEHIARLGELIGELLIFARPVTAAMGPVDLRAVTDHAVSVARAGVADSSGDVVIEGEGHATGDAVLVAQVLQNLVMNALQAGATVVKVRISPARVDVVDNGPGIPPESRERVFQPFFTTKTRGTGLGLPMARRIAEAMQGRLDFLPPNGNPGCHFRLTLHAA
jgi:signal transduction histidine kinase